MGRTSSATRRKIKFTLSIGQKKQLEKTRHRCKLNGYVGFCDHDDHNLQNE